MFSFGYKNSTSTSSILIKQKGKKFENKEIDLFLRREYSLSMTFN